MGAEARRQGPGAFLLGKPEVEEGGEGAAGGRGQPGALFRVGEAFRAQGWAEARISAGPQLHLDQIGHHDIGAPFGDFSEDGPIILVNPEACVLIAASGEGFVGAPGIHHGPHPRLINRFPAVKAGLILAANNRCLAASVIGLGEAASGDRRARQGSADAAQSEIKGAALKIGGQRGPARLHQR